MRTMSRSSEAGSAPFRVFADVVLTSLCGVAAACLLWLGLVSGSSSDKQIKGEGEVVLSEIPQSALTVVIDAGHGGFDGGAVGSQTGVVEADLNLCVARLLADELTARGMYVIMTRSDENALADTKDEDMLTRKRIMQLDNVDIVISIHMNKFTDSTVSGPMVFYMTGSEQGKLLAETVMYSLCEELCRPQRFANPEDLFVLRVPYVPSILVECGFLSNATDELLLMDAEHQKKLAIGIADGLLEYLAHVDNGDSE